MSEELVGETVLDWQAHSASHMNGGNIEYRIYIVTTIYKRRDGRGIWGRQGVTERCVRVVLSGGTASTAGVIEYL